MRYTMGLLELILFLVYIIWSIVCWNQIFVRKVFKENVLCMTDFNFVLIVSLQRPLKVIVITHQLQGVRSVLHCFLSSAFFLGDSWQWYKFMDSNVSFQYMHINVMIQSICWFFRMIRGRLPQKGWWQRWTKKGCSKDVTISHHSMSAGLHFWWWEPSATPFGTNKTAQVASI